MSLISQSRNPCDALEMAGVHCLEWDCTFHWQLNFRPGSHRTSFISILFLLNSFRLPGLVTLFETLIPLSYSLLLNFRVEELEIRKNENKEKEIYRLSFPLQKHQRLCIYTKKIFLFPFLCHVLILALLNSLILFQIKLNLKVRAHYTNAVKLCKCRKKYMLLKLSE